MKPLSNKHFEKFANLPLAHITWCILHSHKYIPFPNILDHIVNSFQQVLDNMVCRVINVITTLKGEHTSFHYVTKVSTPCPPYVAPSWQE